MIDVGVVGVGGFGKSVVRQVRLLEEQGVVRLRAVCEPNTQPNAETLAELRAAGVRTVRQLPEILNLPVQLLWMPVPIPLHRPFVEQALAAGKWVLCEKPAAGCIQHVDAMIAARDRHRGNVAIAYQDIHDLGVPALKRRLLDGAIGHIQDITTICCLPRDSLYYSRNNWAGKLKSGDTWVLDSPCMNAMAHFINLPLFLLGDELHVSARPLAVEAELYRARSIESADTCCLRAHLPGGTRFTAYLTHACPRRVGPRMVIHGTAGRLDLTSAQAAFHMPDGTCQVIERRRKASHSMSAVIERWTGQSADRLVCSLEIARMQVLMVNAAFDATPIHDIDSRHVRIYRDGLAIQPCIDGIEALLQRCAEDRIMLHQAGAEWTQPAGRIDLDGYTAFRGGAGRSG